MLKKRIDLDTPELNDNRDYDFNLKGFYSREEFSIINDWIKDGKNVIDLGCGNDSLMKYLKDKNDVTIEGVEISQSGVDFCLKNNLVAKIGEIDKVETYSEYKDNQFDYAICNVTLQMLMYPEVALKEMMRISKYQIISFPNFAYIENRLEMLLKGVMPKKMLYGYTWYSTGHIHQLSVKDFKELCDKNNLIINKEEYLGFFSFIARFCFKNLLSRVGIYLCQKK